MADVSELDDLLVELLAVQQIQIAVHPNRNLLERRFVVPQEFPHDERNHHGVLNVPLPHQRRDEREIFLEIELDVQRARTGLQNRRALAEAVFAMVRRDGVASGGCESVHRSNPNALCAAT